MFPKPKTLFPGTRHGAGHESRIFGFGINDLGGLWPFKFSPVFRFLEFCLKGGDPLFLRPASFRLIVIVLYPGASCAQKDTHKQIRHIGAEAEAEAAASL